MGTIDFDPLNGGGEQQDASDINSAVARIASLNSHALMPDGSPHDRGEILERLGLDPNTSPTAWLVIIACGKNASGLRLNDLDRLATDNVANASRVLRQVREFRDAEAAKPGTDSGGSASGGAAPGS